ncbi:MAG: DUF4304 domain-containing protein [Kiritimatiellales bacterium]|jgi:hypothetical protein
MVQHLINEKLENVIRSVGLKLKDLGFSGRGLILRILKDGNCGILEFQRSTKSSPDSLLFTVNLGIVCGALLDPPGEQLEKTRIIDAHIRQRLGVFLPDRPDKWWEITPLTNPEVLANELSELILNLAVPYILGLLSTVAIVSLWESGKCPGLTDGQRLRFLAHLQKRNGNAAT